MITVIAQFKLPQPITREEARKTFLSTAPKYKGLPGLIRKYYILSQDGGTAGGVYLWKSKEDAERLYTQEWKNFVREKYGTDASLTYLECLVVVDNVSHEILTGD
jgi:Putative mono-oxygenase ydhR